MSQNGNFYKLNDVCFSLNKTRQELQIFALLLGNIIRIMNDIHQSTFEIKYFFSLQCF